MSHMAWEVSVKWGVPMANERSVRETKHHADLCTTLVFSASAHFLKDKVSRGIHGP